MLQSIKSWLTGNAPDPTHRLARGQRKRAA